MVDSALLLAVLVLILVLPGTSASAPTSTYRDAVLASNPVSYWRLGETSGLTAADEMGSNPGSYVNGVTLGAPGVTRNDSDLAASFDGVNDAVSVTSASSLNATTGVTVEAWVKRTKSGVWQPLVGKPLNGQSKLENYSLWLNTSNRPTAFFGNGSTFVTVSTVGAIDSNWHHIVGTYDNATAKIYLDGTLSATKAGAGVLLTPSTERLSIGTSNSGSYSFGGTLDEVAVYTSVLSAAQIQAHYAEARTDSLAPAVTLAQPVHGSSINDTTPTFSGTAGTFNGDSTTVTVKVYVGPTPSGLPIQTRTTTRQAGGGYSVDALALGEGLYTARAEQSDESGNTGQSSANTFAIDITSPTVTITSAPPNPSNATSASFEFVANEAASGYQCRLDGASFTPCTSPKGYTGLGEGPHSFDVKATDLTGNTGAATTYAWTVDRTAPVVTITDGPPDPSTSDSASFTFSSNEAGSTLLCSLDGAAFASCSSPQTYDDLPDDTHNFHVKAVDAAGNSGAPATHQWRVDTTAPMITLTAPPDGSQTNDPSPTFSGSASTAQGDLDAVTVYVYEGDSVGGPLVQTLTTTQAGGFYSVDAAPDLPDGEYTAQAEQADAVGHTGLSQANTFNVDIGGIDQTPPTILLTTPASGSSTNDTTPTFAGTAGTHQGDLPAVTVNIYSGPEQIGRASCRERV